MQQNNIRDRHSEAYTCRCQILGVHEKVKKIQLKISLVQNTRTFSLGRVGSSSLETIQILAETSISDDLQTSLTKFRTDFISATKPLDWHTVS